MSLGEDPKVTTVNAIGKQAPKQTATQRDRHAGRPGTDKSTKHKCKTCGYKHEGKPCPAEGK